MVSADSDVGDLLVVHGSQQAVGRRRPPRRSSTSLLDVDEALPVHRPHWPLTQVGRSVSWTKSFIEARQGDGDAWLSGAAQDDGAVQIFDGNKDGYWEKSDFEQFVERMATARGYEVGSPEVEALPDVYMGLWESMEPADADGDGRVSLEDALAFQEQHFTPEAVTSFAQVIFPVLDTDGDGEIGFEEYQDYLRTSSIDPAVADEVFPRLDTNGDGRITRAEFEQLYLEYFLSNDADVPGSSLWGPF